MRFVIVTGVSGAGKTSALKMLEDAKYFCVDNLPIPLLEKFASLMPEIHGEDVQQIMFAEKSWGSFKVVDVENTSLTIKVTLNPGHSMNYHSHKNRDEVWVVISGEGKTIVDGMEQMVKPGDVITMSAGCRHTVIADTELKLIEVQLGADINVHDKQKFELEQ